MPKAKFLTDENVAPAIVKALRNLGYGVKDVKEERLMGISDHKVLSLANGEERIVITYDQDFANLLNHPFQSHRGIIILRYSDLRKETLMQKFPPLLDSLVRKKLLENLVIVDDKIVKIIKRQN